MSLSLEVGVLCSILDLCGGVFCLSLFLSVRWVYCVNILDCSCAVESFVREFTVSLSLKMGVLCRRNWIVAIQWSHLREKLLSVCLILEVSVSCRCDWIVALLCWQESIPSVSLTLEAGVLCSRLCGVFCKS